MSVGVVKRISLLELKTILFDENSMIVSSISSSEPCKYGLIEVITKEIANEISSSSIILNLSKLTTYKEKEICFIELFLVAKNGENVHTFALHQGEIEIFIIVKNNATNTEETVSFSIINIMDIEQEANLVLLCFWLKNVYGYKRESNILFNIADVLQTWVFKTCKIAYFENKTLEIMKIGQEQASLNMEDTAEYGTSNLNMLDFVEAKLENIFSANCMSLSSHNISKVNAVDRLGLKKKCITTIPLNIISEYLYYLDQRMECTEKNTEDLWQLVNHLLTENNTVQIMSNQLVELTSKINQFERLIQDVFQGKFKTESQIKDLISIFNLSVCGK